VVTGHKGGVGATTIAVNLAVALAELQSDKLALMDLGRPFPDVGNFLDQDVHYNIFDLIKNVFELDQGFLEKIIQPYEENLMILHGISDFKEQDSISLDALDKIFGLLRSSYKWIIVDLSHWLDDLFLKVLGEADQVILLTALTVPDLRNLGNLWPILRDWQLLKDKVKLVVNRHQKGDGLGLRNLDQVLKEPVFATLPSDHETVVEAINRGVPLGKVAPNSKLWLAIKGLAQKLNQQVQTQEDFADNGRSKRRFWIF
jgi:pilus assembly protein CpaE